MREDLCSYIISYKYGLLFIHWNLNFTWKVLFLGQKVCVLGFYDCEKHHDQKQVEPDKGYFILQISGHTLSGNSWKEPGGKN